MKLVLGMVLALGVASLAAARPDRNAFLNERATSIGQIIAQVKRDPAVRERYRRHFGVDGADLIGFLSSLHATKLPKDGAFIVYSVPPDNRIKAHVQQFGSGTPIYADLTGTPILIAKCGNPLHVGPRLTAANTVESQVEDSVSQSKTLKVEPEAADEVPMGSTVMIPENPYEPLEATEGGSPIIIPAAAGIFSPWLLGLLGGGALIIGGGGGGGGGIDVVPEPGPIAIFLIAGVGLAARSRRRRA